MTSQNRQSPPGQPSAIPGQADRGSFEGTSLDEALATPDAKRRYNQRIFTTIAPRYDLVTRLLSFGCDQRWKDRVVALCQATEASSALDVACGTGDLARRLHDRGARVTALDLTPSMLVCGRARLAARPIRWIAGDIGALPFPDRSFELVTAGYALRNVPDLDCALTELARVLRPGGRLVSLDFTRPTSVVIDRAYLRYLSGVGATLGFVLHRDPDTYRYISASLARFPGAALLAGRMRSAGFAGVEWHPLLGGLMAIHVAHSRGSGVG